MNPRDQYLSQLINFRDTPLIKVITGIRRCGKSSLLALFHQHLIGQGVSDENIININFENLEYEHITSYQKLHKEVKERMKTLGARYYILLDEVQQVKGWEKAVNSLMVDSNADLYITGSNAYLLSSELSTLLSGRYVEIKMLPLSFREYVQFHQGKDEDRNALFQRYLQFGGFPTTIALEDKPETIPAFFSGIYHTVIMKDVVQKNQIRDAALLESLVRFLAANIGNMVSTKKISDYLTSSGRKTNSDTIDNYLSMLEKAFIIYQASRYDIKGKMFLKTLEKYYVVDTGLRNHLAGLRNIDFGHLLENVVYFELLRRGFDVFVGRIGSMEVDFMAVKPDQKYYIQVSASILDKDTRERELRSLRSIKDQYDKLVLTLDQTFVTDYEGIRVKNIIDFLMEDAI